MESKLVYLLIVLLQFWRCALASPMGVELTQLEANYTAFDEKEIMEHATNFPIQIGNKFYHIGAEGVNWHRAVHECRQLGGHLVNFESSEEMDAVIAILPIVSFWMSGNCLAKNRQWVSIATGEPSPYLRWEPNEPNNPKERCIELATYKKAFNDAYCSNPFRYVCEAKII